MKYIPGCLFILPVALLALAGCSGAAKPVTVHYEDAAQVELIDASGQRLLIDVYNPSKLSTEPTGKEALLTTHSHSDHLDNTFLSEFRGQTLTMKTGELTVGGVKVRGIAGSHDGKAPEDINGTGSNYVFIIEMGGLRIAHFGDLGQDTLTPAQLEALGKIDVAVMQFANSYSSMSAENKKGFNLADQVKPRLIIPTHINEPAIKYAVEKWKAAFSEAPLSLTPGNLPKETTIVFMGDFAGLYGKAYKLTEWGK